MTYRIYKVFLLFLIASFISVSAFAQNANSSINGTVKDTPLDRRPCRCVLRRTHQKRTDR